MIRAKLIAAALAAKIPTAAVDPTAQAYDSLDAASQAFFSQLDHSSGNEYAGALFRDADGKYRYSIPMNGKSDKFSMQIQKNPNAIFSGIMHTHPGQEDSSQYFSANDVDTAKTLKVPSYVWFEKSNQERKYIPGQTSASPIADHLSWGVVSRGDPVSDLAKALIAARQPNSIQPPVSQPPLDIGEGK